MMDQKEAANNLAPLVVDGLGLEACRILKQKFARLESIGPSWAAKVAEENGENREQVQQAAFQDAQDLFDNLKVLQNGQ